MAFLEYSPGALGPEMGMICATLPISDEGDPIRTFTITDRDDGDPMDGPFFTLDPED